MSDDVRSHSTGQRQRYSDLQTNSAHGFHTMCMETFESSCTVTITGSYDPQPTATEYISIRPNVKLL